MIEICFTGLKSFWKSDNVIKCISDNFSIPLDNEITKWNAHEDQELNWLFLTIAKYPNLNEAF